MPRTKQSTDVSIYQIKITLGHSKPAIWRRVLVKSDTRFGKFHEIVQLAMGWTDSHLHQFIVGKHPAHTLICEPYEGVEDLAPRVLDERKVKLSDAVLGAKERLFYEYDFGDGWEHEILVEKILKPEAGMHYPVCIEGKHACPPEDCGGIWGYYEFLAAIKDEDHPDHEDQLDWVGGEFDPEAFDLDETNKALRRIK
ncbi:MAG: plasmid pRiA4b ORF-3 family protein [Blastocatellia bacterium]